MQLYNSSVYLFIILYMWKWIKFESVLRFPQFLFICLFFSLMITILASDGPILNLLAYKNSMFMCVCFNFKNTLCVLLLSQRKCYISMASIVHSFPIETHQTFKYKNIFCMSKWALLVTMMRFQRDADNSNDLSPNILLYRTILLIKCPNCNAER